MIHEIIVIKLAQNSFRTFQSHLFTLAKNFLKGNQRFTLNTLRVAKKNKANTTVSVLQIINPICLLLHD